MTNYKVITATIVAVLEKRVQSLCALGYAPNGAPIVTLEGFAQAVTGHPEAIATRTVTILRPALPDSEPVTHASNGIETYAEMVAANKLTPEGDVLMVFNGKRVDGDDLPLTDGVLQVMKLESCPSDEGTTEEV